MIIQHPDIHSTGLKEIFTFKDIKSYEQYIKLFKDIDGVQVDGTPYVHKKRWFKSLIRKLKEDFDRTAFIYIKREQTEHWKSQISHGFLLGFINYIDLDSAIDNLKPHEIFIDMLAEIYNDDLLIIDFENLENCQRQIYNFLKVDNSVEYDLPRLNSLDSLTSLRECIEIKKIIEKKWKING